MADGQSLLPPGLDKVRINPFDPALTIFTSPMIIEQKMVNPFGSSLEIELLEETNATVSNGFSYRKFYISRAVFFPSILLMILFSILLIYIIVRHLRAVIKLYISVIFYAVSILFFASQIILIFVYDYANPGKVPDCNSWSQELMYSFQLAGIIMPAMAVLVITAIRVIFLKSPFNWRNILTFRNQALGVLAAVLLTFALGMLPLFRVCELEMFSKQCVLFKNWTAKCVSCFVLSLGMGLVLPKVVVVVLYYVIYCVVKKARARTKSLSSTTRNATCSSLLSSDATANSGNKDAKDSGKSGAKESKTERELFPWSIIVILLLNVVSAIPWIVLIGAPELLYKNKTSEVYLILDVMYASLLVATAISPLAYLITTKVVRDKTLHCLKNCCCCLRYYNN